MHCMFGIIDLNGEMHLNQFGIVVRQEWERVGTLRPNVELDAFVVMPNHVHSIIFIMEDSIEDRQPLTLAPPVGARLASPMNQHPGGPSAKSLGAIVGGFKSAVTREINRVRSTPGADVWQRSFHDVIIRNEKMLNTFRQYIDSNPVRWANDRYYVE